MIQPIDFNTIDELTDEQIEAWRKILFLEFGAYALIAPREQIEEIRNKMQEMIDVEFDGHN